MGDIPCVIGCPYEDFPKEAASLNFHSIVDGSKGDSDSKIVFLFEFMQSSLDLHKSMP